MFLGPVSFDLEDRLGVVKARSASKVVHGDRGIPLHVVGDEEVLLIGLESGPLRGLNQTML